MRKKGIIEGTAAAVSKHLPKTTNAIDEIGSTIFGFFGTLLAPLQAINIYKDIKMEELKRNWESKVREIPEDQRKDTIELNVVGPAIEAFKYAFMEDELRNMFENLLVSSFDKRKIVFPSFVDIIRQLNSDEAKLLKYLSANGTDYPIIDLHYVLDSDGGYSVVKSNFSDVGDGVLEKPELITPYLNDLNRFGLIEIQTGVFLADDSLYTKLENNTVIQNAKKETFSEPGKYEIHKKKFVITDYGKAFIESCVK